ncbi:aldo/keto reductase [Gephyromycinifex aptenodytis]|uniref:aldo/keto reductase n=1 Tax=Gephyromycinifex aptenodytis TaxID=2716227 RepID=UPI00144725C7|nr:aldo/keto reductase [Gephyromycinifex aptenodytis]
MSEPALAPMADGRAIPELGIGLYLVEEERAEQVVLDALEAGYRHVDTASFYGNETAVRRALDGSGVAEDDVFITTKVWNSDHGRQNTRAAFEASMERLGLDVLDLYLIHWAVPSRQLYLPTWEALIELQEQGRVRSIGVCNFPAAQLREIIAATGVVPALHQIELHPWFAQRELRALHAEYGIRTQAWSPLRRGRELLADPVLTRIAAEHDATPAQITLAWHRAHGIATIPKSVTRSRIIENFASLDVQLSAADIAQIDALDRPDGRTGSDPATMTRLD